MLTAAGAFYEASVQRARTHSQRYNFAWGCSKKRLSKNAGRTLRRTRRAQQNPGIKSRRGRLGTDGEVGHARARIRRQSGRSGDSGRTLQRRGVYYERWCSQPTTLVIVQVIESEKLPTVHREKIARLFSPFNGSSVSWPVGLTSPRSIHISQTTRGARALGLPICPRGVRTPQ